MPLEMIGGEFTNVLGVREPAVPEPEPVKEVFVSYSWRSDDSVSIIDQLEQAFRGRDVQLSRDKSEMKYKDPFVPSCTASASASAS
jgi:hypothetical protein